MALKNMQAPKEFYRVRRDISSMGAPSRVFFTCGGGGSRNSMRKIRNKLLIALVLFGVVLAAGANAQTVRPSQFGYSPLAATSPKSAFLPGASPTAGEPDVGQGSAPIRLSMRGSARTSQPVVTSSSVKLVSTLRWAFAMWMARYLNQTP